MKTDYRKKLSSFILCTVLIVAMALPASGCGSKPDSGKQPASGPETETAADGSVLGEGSLQFPFTVTDPDGNETSFEIHTEKETVGEALSELGLIEGEDSEYGLFVQTVCGITLDYDKDGLYWAFYINDEYAQTSVDMTKIEDGASYSFRIE